jgi:hypothetical protein
MPIFNFSLANIAIILATTALVAATVWIASIAWRRAETPDLGRRQKRHALTGLGIFFAAVAIVTFLAVRGFFSVAQSVPPRGFVLFLLILGSALVLVVFRINGGLAILKQLPPHYLIFIQSYRIVIELILIMLYNERLIPRELTLEGRNFDILIGLTAPVVGYLVAKKPEVTRTTAIIWNVVGILSLLNIGFIAAFSVPSPFRVFATNYLPTYFPGILIPTVIVTFALCFHILSLKQLLHMGKRARKAAAA